MKKSRYFSAVLMILATLGCSGQNGRNEQNPNPSSGISSNESAQHAAVSINKADFLRMVMDYEKNPDTWNYKGEVPCIIDFYADWCAPCRITSPILEELANQYSGKIRVYKVDIEKEQELASIFGIQSIPTFLFCPMEGNPTISSGIANTPDATRDMFREQIEKLLLKQDNSSNL